MLPLSLPDIQQCPADIDTRCTKSDKMQMFSQVPNEILENIFLEDILSRSDLCKLALVSRRFSKLIQASLYHDIYILWSIKRYACFKRTLLDCPQLGSFVWRLYLIADGNADYDAFNKDIQKLLQKMPALRSLKLSERFKCNDKLLSLFEHEMTCLRSLSFGNDGSLSSIPLFLKAFSVPQIKRPKITFDYNSADCHTRMWIDECSQLLDCSEDSLVGRSSIKELVLDFWSGSAIVDSGLLRIPRAIGKLELLFVDLRQFIAKKLVDALRPLCSTLVFLNLSCVSFAASFSGPVADFSCFDLLKTLIIDDRFCLERWSADRPDERCKIYNRLPFTLERLEVSLQNRSLTEGMSSANVVIVARSTSIEIYTMRPCHYDFNYGNVTDG
jgi:hypothetical protein